MGIIIRPYFIYDHGHWQKYIVHAEVGASKVWALLKKARCNQSNHLRNLSYKTTLLNPWDSSNSKLSKLLSKNYDWLISKCQLSTIKTILFKVWNLLRSWVLKRGGSCKGVVMGRVCYQSQVLLSNWVELDGGVYSISFNKRIYSITNSSWLTFNF